MKQCTKCKLTKPFDDFGRRSKSKDGLKPECRPCTADRLRAWRQANPERDRENMRRWREANKQLRPAHERMTKYGLAHEDYEFMMADQNERCLICGHVMEPPVVDHDHETGNVRGLLCRTCNMGLGSFKDSPVLLEAAIWYLNREES